MIVGILQIFCHFWHKQRVVVLFCLLSLLILPPDASPGEKSVAHVDAGNARRRSETPEAAASQTSARLSSVIP